MKAYVLHGVNDLRYEDVAEPELREDWALVKVHTVGICSSDIPRIFTKGTYHFPTIPGHEFSGTVTQVGAAVNADLIGKRVGIFPLIPCRTCRCCQNRQYEMCDSYDYVGSRRDGAFAEYVAVPVRNLIEIPEGMGMDEAAMLEPLSVALHAVKRLDIHSEDEVAIIGTGMIGFAAAQWALSKGAKRVCIVARSQSKISLLESCPGIEFMLEKDLMPNSFTKVIEAVGTVQSICSAIQAVGAAGTVVLMGNPAGDIELPQNVYWKILRKQLKVTGTWNSAFESCADGSDWVEAVEAIKDKKVHVTSLVTHRFNQSQLKESLELMRNHSQVYCKILVEWNGK